MRVSISSTPKLLSPAKDNMIAKELIKELHFPKGDVLVNKFEQIMRSKDLDQAIALGNIYHSKVTIKFEDIEGLKKVSTTVWGQTDTHAILKGDIFIPINRITSINY